MVTRLTQALIVSSTFTADPLRRPLQHYLGKFDRLLSEQLTFAPYNQIFQDLEYGQGVIAQYPHGIHLLVIRPEDLVHFRQNLLDDQEYFATVRAELIRFSEILLARAETLRSAQFILLIGDSTDRRMQRFTQTVEGQQNYREMIEYFQSLVMTLPNISWIGEHEIAKVFPQGVAYYDSFAEDQGHIPYRMEYYHALGYLLARKIFDIAILSTRPLKAMILDCDNTLWRGVCGELGATGVEVTPAYTLFQRYLKAAQEHGVLLCLCSKNNEADVLEVFNQNQGMLLAWSDIAAYQINWRPKSENVHELIKFLEFSEHNVVFVDDREDECQEVQRRFPELLTIHLPAEGSIPQLLENLWIFDHANSTTAEDRKRTTFYREKFLSAHNKNLANTEYLYGNVSTDTIVELFELKVEESTAEEMKRAAELTSRTNQFNLAKRIYSVGQLSEMLTDGGYRAMLANVKDRHGNEYGLTGLVIFQLKVPRLVVDTFLLSCRVIGKEVERVLLEKLWSIAQSANLSQIQLPFIPSSRNKPAELFLNSIASIQEEPSPSIDSALKSLEVDENSIRFYRLMVDANLSISYQTPVSTATNQEAARDEDLQRLVIQHNLAILEIAHEYSSFYTELTRTNSQPSTLPTTESIGEELLEMLRGICGEKLPLPQSLDPFTASFVASGIDSFELMMWLSKIYHTYQIRFDLSEILQLDSVAAVVAELERKDKSPQRSATQAPEQEDSTAEGWVISAAQAALWIERLKLGDDAVYNLFRVFQLRGSLDLARLTRALRTVITNHSILRTAFLESEQSILPVGQILQIEEMVLLNCQPVVQEIMTQDWQQILPLIYREVQRNFDLAHPPVLRVVWFKGPNDEGYLLIVMHHIISDGWSFNLLIKELSDYYRSDLPCSRRVPKSYRSFVIHQNRQYPAALAQHQKFLEHHFQNYPGLSLPYDFSGVKVSSSRGSRFDFCLEAELTKQIYQISMHYKVTIYEIVLAAHLVFLAKLCRQSEVALASIVATRPPEYLSTIGYLVNLVTIRYSLAKRPTFLQMLKEIQEYFLQIRQVSEIPFLELINEYRQFIPAVEDLLMVILVFENFPNEDLQLADIQTSEMDCGNYLTLSLPNTAKFDLAFYFKDEPNKGKIYGTVEFRTDCFVPETIQQWVEQFITILKKLTTEIMQPIFD